jgi:hypothetical protein
MGKLECGPAAYIISTHPVANHLCVRLCSASPLNGQAAELWDSNPEEYKRLVLGRHRDIEDGE